MVKFLFLFVGFYLLSGCSNKSKDKNAIKFDYEDVEIKYAENFALKKIDNGYLLELIEPGTTKVTNSYKIYPSKNKKIISLTATLNGMLAELGSQKLLVGISDIHYVFDPTIKKMFRQGKIGVFGGMAENSIEKIIASEATIIFYDLIDDKFPNQEKLQKLGVNVMPIYDWRENHPLAKAEWIKVVGAITGKMKEANAFFDEVEGKYESLKIKGSKYKNRPTVLCGNLISDTWYTPSGENYFAMLIKNAGGNYRYEYTKGTFSLGLTIEQILNDNLNTDFWLNPGYKKKSLILKMNPHAMYLKAFNKNLYCYSKGMNKFWEQSASRPDLVLSDLIHILHPEEKSIQHFNFYSKIN